MIDTMLERFVELATTQPHSVAYDVWPAGAHAVESQLTWGEWQRDARQLAGAMLEYGVAPGDCVLIFADNVPLWPIVDLATLMVRGIGVGAYPTSAVAQLTAQIVDCGARLVFADTPERCAMILSASLEVPWTVRVVSADEWRSWSRVDSGTEAARDAQVSERMQAIVPSDDALLIYTSGSTGVPKGARIYHRYLTASATSIAQTLGLRESDTGVCFLPFCHAAERVFGMYTRLSVGMRAVLVESTADLWAAMQATAPTVFGGVPRLFEKLAERLPASASTDEQANALSRMLGRKVRIATSGGAALPLHVARQLERAGLTVLGAYGQTEHLCVAMNRPDSFRLDTVGAPMVGTEIHIDRDGQLLVKRNQLTFSGYFGRPDETRAAFNDDGQWLCTGDLASQDADGMLRITGRVKDLIALSNGKKVAPSPIEAELSASPLIAAAVCVGEGRHFLSAVLQIDRVAATAFAGQHAIHDAWPALLAHPDIRQAINAHVETVNGQRSRPEQVRAFCLVSDEWSVGDGALTATWKLRRSALVERYGAEIDALYGSSAEAGAV